MEAAIPTGSGARHPMFGPDKKHIYVCNQFDNSVVEVDPVMRKVVRSVKVLREPKSAVVFSKDGKYMFVTNFLPAQRADVDVGGRLRIGNRDGWVYESERYPIGEW